MSSTNYMNAGKRLIQQKVDEIFNLKELIQRDVVLLINNVVQEASTLLQVNDRKLFRSRYKDVNEILESSLLRLHTISSSIRGEGDGEGFSDSESSFDESEFAGKSLKCKNNNNSGTMTTVTNSETSMDADDFRLIASSPIRKSDLRSGSERVEEAVLGAVKVPQRSTGCEMDNEGNDGAANGEDDVQASSSPVEPSSQVTENGRLDVAGSSYKAGNFSLGYDADFERIMSKLNELKKKTPVSASSEDTAVRELLSQQVKDFFIKISDNPKHDVDDRQMSEDEKLVETSSETLVVDSDPLQISKGDESSSVVNDIEVEVDRSNLEDGDEETATLESSVLHLDINGLEIKLGSELVACVTHVESPSLFYVRQLDLDTQEILIDNLNQHYDSHYRMQLTEKPWLGLCCCALEIEKNTWSRAIVTEIHASESTNSEVSVFYVDYGHTEKLSVVRLKKLCESFRHIPRQAIPCCVYDVEPPQQRADFNEVEIEFFRSLVSDSNVKITFRGLGPVKSVEIMKLMDETEDGPFNVSKILVEAGIASYGSDVQLPSLEIPTSKPSKESLTFPPTVDSTVEAVKVDVHKNEDLPSSDASDVKLSQNVSSSSDWTSWTPSKAAEKISKDKISFSIGSSVTSQLDKSSILSNEDNGFSKYDGSSEATDVEVVRVVGLKLVSKHASETAKEKKDADLLGRFDIPRMKLNSKKSEFLQGMVAVMNSPSDFYIHFGIKDVLNIDELNDEINESLSKNEAPPLILDPARIAVGSYWCCRSSVDDRWYRAKILEVMVDDSSSSSSPAASVSSDDEGDKKNKKRRKRKQTKVSSKLPKVTVHVLYIDYGDDGWVGAESLRMIYKKFCKLPALAVKCQMTHISPKSVDGEWSREATELLKGWTADNKLIKVQLFDDVDTVELDVALNVYLWDLDNEEGKLFNEELVNHGLAISDIFLSDDTPPTSNVHCVDEMKNLEAWDPMGADYRSDRNSYAVDIDDAGVALTGYKARDELDICMFYQRGQLCPRSLGCPYKHIQPSKDGITTDQKIIPYVKETVTLPPLEEYVVVVITAIYNPGKFFVHFPLTSEPIEKLKAIPNWTPPSENIYVLEEELQEEYNKITSKRFGSYLVPAIGEIVVARYSGDHCWYRARVIDFYLHTNEAVVYFIDYGNEDTVSHDDIRAIQTRFQHLPVQAVECSLYGIKPRNDEVEWSDTAKLIFEKLSVGQPVIKVKDISCDKMLVTLHNTAGDSSIILNDALVNAEVACYTTEASNATGIPSRRRPQSTQPFLR